MEGDRQPPGFEAPAPTESFNGNDSREEHMRNRILAFVGALSLFVALFSSNLAPASAGVKWTSKPKALAAAPLDAGRTWTAPLASAPKVALPPRADVTAHPVRGKTCTDGAYRIQTSTTFYQNVTNNLWMVEKMVMTQQRLIGNPAVWQNNDWANSATLRVFVYGGVTGNSWGPANPPTSVTLFSTAAGVAPPANVYALYNISGTGAGTPNISCKVTP